MKYGLLVVGLCLSALAQAQTLVGRTAGEPGASVFGAARYVVPLVLPPGTNGLAPELAITYDSHGGNGLLGVGFQLAGLSAIERCVATIAQDGVPAAPVLERTDRLCLDGKRLRLTAGFQGAAASQYQLEVEEFARVTAYGQSGNGPQYFTVEAPNGLVREYGATSDSRIESIGSTSVRVWALNRIRDRSGNQVDFVYNEDTVNGSYRPSRIDYTGNTLAGTLPYYSVRFTYEARPGSDLRTGFAYGAAVNESQRLDRIDVVHIASVTPVRSYDLTYGAASASGRSRLESLQECVGSQCLTPTRFAWSSYLNGWGGENSLGSIGLTDTSLTTPIPGDMDGDGAEDLAWFNATVGRWFVLRGSPQGYLGPALDTRAGSPASQSEALGADLDGDGRRDILTPASAAGGVRSWYWLRQSGPGTFAFVTTGVPVSSPEGSTTVADIDGDGRDDLVYVKANNASVFWRRSLTVSATPSFAPEAVLWTSPVGGVGTYPFGTPTFRFGSTARRADFDGDGRSDLLFMQSHDCGADRTCSTVRAQWVPLLSRGTTLIARGVVETASLNPPSLGDFNGDGLTDIAYPATRADFSIEWRLRFGTAATAAGSSAMSTEVLSGLTAPIDAVRIYDWDGDRRGDLMYSDASGTWRYCRSNGNSLDVCRDSGLLVSAGSSGPYFTDINGDGRSDVIFTAPDWRFRLQYGGAVDTLASATDGHGRVASYAYGVLTTASVHTAASGSAYPVRDAVPAVTVVTRITQPDGNGGSFNSAFAYAGARSHAHGRGFLGFARRSVTDSRTGLVTIEDYPQDPLAFERLGRATAVTLQQAAGQPLVRRSLTWASTSFGTGNEIRRFPYVAAETVDKFELDGTRVTSAVYASTYDLFGTLIDRTETINEIARGSNPGARHVTRITASLVANDTTNWCLGRPGNITERRSHTLPGGVEVVRSTDYLWDLTRCRMTQSTLEPASTTLRVATSLTYDAWGNVASSTVTPIGEAARSTTFGWIEGGRFIGSLRAPDGQSSTYVWDTTRARLNSARDPNGLQMQWTHDALNRIAAFTRPDGTSIAISRAPCGTAYACASSAARYATLVVDRAVGGATIASSETGYDLLGRSVYVKRDLPGAVASLSVTRYDTLGRLSQQSAPVVCCAAPSLWSTASYDLLNRQIALEHPISATVSTPVITRWRHDGLNVTQTDSLGRSTTRRRSARGDLIQIIDAAGADIDYEYDAFGNLIKVRDFAGTETVLAYDTLGNRIRLTDPDMGVWNFQYSGLGEIKSLRNPRGQTTTYTYDLLGRVVQRSEPEGLTTWTFGDSAAARNIGALASVSAPGFLESYAYDAVGRVATVQRDVAGVSLLAGYTYDPATGLLDTLSYPTRSGTPPFRLKHGYERGRLTSLSDADQPANVFWRLTGVDARGLASRITLGNGVQITRAFDAFTGEVQSIASGPGATATLQNLAYRWDAVGNLLERSDLNRNLSEQFVYDSRDRLDYSRLGGLVSLGMAYDETGNPIRKSDIGNYAYDAVRKHAVTSAGTNQYQYDANGALIQASGTTVAWTSFDQPLQVVHPNGNYAQFSYDANHLRYRQVTRAAATVTDTLSALDGRYELSSSGGVLTERQHVVAEGRIVATRIRSASATPSVRYLLHDHLGSVDAITSETGTLLARLSYQPFGARRAGDWQGGAPSGAEWTQILAVTSRGYTGHEHLDNLGLINMNGRMFDPMLGRFMSPDPVMQSSDESQSLNRYSYVGNNPLRYTDPTGNCANGHPAADSFAMSCYQVMGIDNYMVFGNAFAAAAMNASMLDRLTSLAATVRLGQIMAAAASVPEPASSPAIQPAVPTGDLAPTVVVTATRLPAMSLSATLLAGTLRAPALSLPRFAGMLMTGAAGGIALGVLAPSTTADDDLSDDKGQPRYVYHFTNELGKRGIGTQGALLPGASGQIYFSPVPYASAAQARQALSLPRLPTGYYIVPRENISSPLVWTPVAPAFGQPGGGLEAATTIPVPTQNAQWVPLGP